MSIVEEMRRSFDESFSKPESRTQERAVRLLAVRAKESFLLLRTDQIHQIVRCPPLAAMPGASSPFLGIGGVRGTIVGFYGLSALAGGGTATAAPWAALCGRTRTIGLVFDEILAAIERPPEELKEMVEIVGRAHALIDVIRIVAAIEPRGE